MNKVLLLPKMAVTGVRKNGIVYLPYILTTSFSVCIFFIFSCIIKNDLLLNVPHAGYVVILLQIGQVLLGIILIPFLFYTNSFLVKRRKKEIGLYSILGLEKRHIGFMMFMETLIIFVVSMVVGLAVASVFAKLVFLVLLNACGLPVTTEFTMTSKSVISTFFFFGIVSLLNLITNLVQVTIANPVDLLSGPKKGEKEPKHLWIPTILGIIFLGGGYYIAITSKMDSMIFASFFLAVFMVVVGTYFLFTSGSIALLRGLRKNKKFYYQKSNYVTVSGMLYRMKKSAASLVNICIFSTMVIITLLCTVSLTLGEKDAIRYQYPYDAVFVFDDSASGKMEQFEQDLNGFAADNNVAIPQKIEFSYYMVDAINKKNEFDFESDASQSEDRVTVRMLSLEDYNQIESKNESLKPGEILIYSTTTDLDFSAITMNGEPYNVKKELASFSIDTKEKHSYGNRNIYIVMENKQSLEEQVLKFKEGTIKPLHSVRFNMKGDKAGQEAFLKQLTEHVSNISGYCESGNIIDWGSDIKSMDGGLLFIGVFFGLLFTICVVLIMYYKQIAEGMEDQQNFDIMQQVGMSDADVKATINRQIKLVFGVPLVAAIIHTFVGLGMTINLLYALNLYNTKLIVICAFGIIILFTIFYGFSYLMTAKTYYKLVKRTK